MAAPSSIWLHLPALDGASDREEEARQVSFPFPFTSTSRRLWPQGLCKAPGPQPLCQVPFARVPTSDSANRPLAGSARSTAWWWPSLATTCPAVQLHPAATRALCVRPTLRCVVGHRRQREYAKCVKSKPAVPEDPQVAWAGEVALRPRVSRREGVGGQLLTHRSAGWSSRSTVPNVQMFDTPEGQMMPELGK